jgi:hypothetical protein
MIAWNGCSRSRGTGAQHPWNAHFSNLVREVEKNGEGPSRLLELTKVLGGGDGGRRPKVCPNSSRIATDLDFKITQISDCVVVSAEVSPAAVIALNHHCVTVAQALVHEGTLCRGYVTRGNIYHEERQFIGTGYMRAVENEKTVVFKRADLGEQETPFIQIDESVTEYVRDEGDECVCKMFARCTTSDGTYTAARKPRSTI